MQFTPHPLPIFVLLLDSHMHCNSETLTGKPLHKCVNQSDRIFKYYTLPPILHKTDVMCDCTHVSIEQIIVQVLLQTLPRYVSSPKPYGVFPVIRMYILQTIATVLFHIKHMQSVIIKL